jgi:chitinase
VARERSRSHSRFRKRNRVVAVAAAAAVLTAGGLLAFGTANASEGAGQAAGAAVAQPAVGASKVPAHAVTGYWQDFDNGAKTQKLTDVPGDYDIIAVAFAEATGQAGKVDFKLDPATGYSSDDAFKADIKSLHDKGKSVILSVGGEKGAVQVTDDASASAFADSITGLMDTYGFDGVDIDLENGLNSTYMTKALKAIHDKKSDVVVTMAPQTIDMQSPDNEYFKTALATKDFLTAVNMQYYNSGSMNGCDGKTYAQGSVDFLTSLACIQIKGGLSPSQVGIGTPASSQAAGSGYVEPKVVTDAVNCLAKGTGCGSFKPEKTYPDLRGAMTWSTNWDASNGNAWSKAVGAAVHGLS